MSPTTSSHKQYDTPKYKIAVLAPTCHYYQIALYQQLARSPEIDLEVYFCSEEALQASDAKKQFSTDQTWQVEGELLEGYNHRFLRNYSPHPSYLTPLIGLINLGIWKLIGKERPDVLIMMGWGSVTWWLAILACLWFKIPYFLMADPPVQAEFSKSRLKRLLKTVLIGKLIFGNSSGFLCSGTANRRLYQLYGVPEHKLVHFAYSGGYSDLLQDSNSLRSRKKEIREELGIPCEKRAALFCGRLSHEKNISALLEAYERIESTNKSLIIVGDGDLMGKLQAHVASHQLNDVFFFGFQNRKEIGKFYAAADFLVLPSFRETWGLVVNEAMCFGLPIIASDQVGSVDDLVFDGKNGYRYPPHDTSELAIRMAEMVESPPDKISSMSACSLDMIQAWSARDITKDLTEFLNELNIKHSSQLERSSNRVLLFTRHYLPGYKAGGPVRALANLVDEIGEEFDLRIITSDRDSGDKSPYPKVQTTSWHKTGKAYIRYLEPSGQSLLALRRMLRKLDYDVWHFTSLFSPVFTAKILLLQRLWLLPRRPVIIAPRGELAPAALRFKYIKKRFFLIISKRLGFYKQVIWHASSSSEVEDIVSEFGAHSHITVAPDFLKSKPMRFSEGISSKKTSGKLNLIFLSRVAEIKNLSGVIDMLQNLKGDICLNIYGQVDDAKYWRHCQTKIDSLPANITVKSQGSVVPEKCVKTFSEHDLFIFPTFSESFGHVVYEAIAGGCPVLVSDQTPWRNLEETGAGWDVSLSDQSEFQSILQKCADMGPVEHTDLRQAAHKLAVEVYTNSSALTTNRALLTSASKMTRGLHSLKRD